MVRAIVLLSGGLDSCVTACIAKKDYELHALSFDYKQRHKKELDSAKNIAERLGIEHRIIRMELPERSDALTSELIDVPHNREIGKDVPVTYVPARNTIFISYALSWSEVIDARAIFIGANSVDFSGYPDCRPQYVEAWNELIKVGMKNNDVRVVAPLINMSKAEIVREGVKLNAPLELTWSCYEGREKACGVCDSCMLRLKGFREAGFKDPVEYEI